MNRNDQSELLAPFWDHTEALRLILLKIVLIILVGTSICFTFTLPLFHLLEKTLPTFSQNSTYLITHERIVNESEKPLNFKLNRGETALYVSHGVGKVAMDTYMIPAEGYLEIKRLQKKGLMLFSPFEGFSGAFKLSFWAAVFLTTPLWLWQILSFVIPGLKNNERSVLLPFIGITLSFICLGIFIALFMTIPLTNTALYTFNSRFGENLWGFSAYLDYTLLLLLGHGTAFACLSLLFCLIHYQKLNYKQLANKRKYAIILILIISALLTPPDIISQILLAIPLMALYEVAIVYGKLKSLKKVTWPAHG